MTDPRPPENKNGTEKQKAHPREGGHGALMKVLLLWNPELLLDLKC